MKKSKKVNTNKKIDHIVSSKLSFDKVVSTVALPVILFLSLMIRLISAFKPNLIFDEGYTALAVQGVLRTGQPFLPSDIIYPRGIVYTYISAGFDYFIQDTVVSIRLVSIIFGVLGVLAAFLLARELFRSKGVGMFAAIMTSFSFYLIEISRYGRFYSQMLALFLFATYFALKTFDFEQKFSRKWYHLIGLLVTGTLTIFSDSLGIGVLIPVGAIALYDILLSFESETIHPVGVLKWLKSNWFVVLIVGIVLAVAAYGQFKLERESFYTVYRKLIDVSDTRSNALNVPISFSGVKFIGFGWALFKTYIFETLAFLIAVLALKFGSFKSDKVAKKAFWILTFTMFLFFVFVSSVAPQFQLRYFYIFYVLGVVVLCGLVKFIEDVFEIKGLLRFAAFIAFLYFLILLPFTPLEKSMGSIVDQTFLPSASLDYYPDSRAAFTYAVKESKKKPYNYESPQILVSTYRKELSYYGSDFNGIKVLIVPYDLETSLASMPEDIYYEYARESRANIKGIAEDLGSLSIILEKDENTWLDLMDPVTGYAVVRPEDVISLVEKSKSDVYMITSRFDYHEQYVSERYRKFLENRQDMIVYEAKDEGYSNVYRFVKD